MIVVRHEVSQYTTTLANRHNKMKTCINDENSCYLLKKLAVHDSEK